MSTDFTTTLPHFQNWSAQDLADAVPRRLSDLITPELMRFDRDDEAVNGVARAPLAFAWRRHNRAESLFRVR